MPRLSRYRSSVSVALVAVASLARLVAAHGDHAEVEQNPDATYTELHMAQEVRWLRLPHLWPPFRSFPSPSLPLSHSRSQ